MIPLSWGSRTELLCCLYGTRGFGRILKMKVFDSQFMENIKPTSKAWQISSSNHSPHDNSSSKTALNSFNSHPSSHPLPGSNHLSCHPQTPQIPWQPWETLAAEAELAGLLGRDLGLSVKIVIGGGGGRAGRRGIGFGIWVGWWVGIEM